MPSETKQLELSSSLPLWFAAAAVIFLVALVIIVRHFSRRLVKWQILKKERALANNYPKTVLICSQCRRKPPIPPSSSLPAVIVEARAALQRQWLLSKGLKWFTDVYKKDRQLPCVICGKLYQAPPADGGDLHPEELQQLLQEFLDCRDGVLESVQHRSRMESFV
jgi:hypothetical protein